MMAVALEDACKIIVSEMGRVAELHTLIVNLTSICKLFDEPIILFCFSCPAVRRGTRTISAVPANLPSPDLHLTGKNVLIGQAQQALSPGKQVVAVVQMPDALRSLRLFFFLQSYSETKYRLYFHFILI